VAAAVVQQGDLNQIERQFEPVYVEPALSRITALNSQSFLICVLHCIAEHYGAICHIYVNLLISNDSALYKIAMIIL
jgi:hypothetical protein